MTDTSRRVERTVTIDAPVDAVWKALTDATELTRWFPLRASVTPGAGGVIHMEWDESYNADSRIEQWEPGRHLRIAFPNHQPVLLATDYHLATERGRTVLRVVTSGFGEGAHWDDWYAGVGAGWNFELRSLVHYLEHHRGQDRHVASVRLPFTGDADAVWERLASWFAQSGLTGTRLVEVAPVQLVTTVDQYNNGLLRLEIEMTSHAIVWLATWDVSPDTIATLARDWKHSLAAALGEQ